MKLLIALLALTVGLAIYTFENNTAEKLHIKPLPAVMANTDELKKCNSLDTGAAVSCSGYWMPAIYNVEFEFVFNSKIYRVSSKEPTFFKVFGVQFEIKNYNFSEVRPLKHMTAFLVKPDNKVNDPIVYKPRVQRQHLKLCKMTELGWEKWSECFQKRLDANKAKIDFKDEIK